MVIDPLTVGPLDGHWTLEHIEALRQIQLEHGLQLVTAHVSDDRRGLVNLDGSPGALVLELLHLARIAILARDGSRENPTFTAADGYGAARLAAVAILEREQTC